MILDYEELKEILVQKGADAKLLDMPAIKERLMKQNISAEDILVNPDGTFNFGNCVMQRKKLEKEEIVSDIHQEVDDYGVDALYFTHKKKKYEQEVIAIVESKNVIAHTNDALDAPFSTDSDYVSEYEETIATLTYVDSDGLEAEVQKIDNSLFVDKQLKQGSLSLKTFEERQDLVSKRTTRENGLITEKDSKGVEYKFYDNGKWNIDLEGTSSFGTREGDSPASAISRFDYNSQKLLKKYPQLQSTIKMRKQELEAQIDERTLAMRSKIYSLSEDNEKLKKMLEKTLTFAQTVRNSVVGKLFFGKQSKEILGEQNKSTKKLPQAPSLPEDRELS